MKLRDYMPQDSEIIEKQQKLDSMLSFYGSLSKSGGQSYYRKPFGIDRVIHEWIRAYVGHRPSFLQALYTIAYSVAELRVTIINVRNEVFRRGFDKWLPKFTVKCKDCGEEYEEEIEQCENEECKSTNLVKPDKKQYEEFDKKFRDDCNIFDQSIEEVLRIGFDDALITDDCFLYLNKEYYEEKEGGELHSKVMEIERLHPALVEFDISPQGLPKDNHLTCILHREEVIKEVIRDERGFRVEEDCPICKRKLVPVMYIYTFMGTKYYLLDEEIIHYCYDKQTELLTDKGWKSISEVSTDENVMTYNALNGYMEYNSVKRIYQYPAPEFMYKVTAGISSKGSYIDLLVTPNHNLFVDEGDGYKLGKAKDMFRKQMKFLVAADWQGKEQKTFILPEATFRKANQFKVWGQEVFSALSVDMDDWLEFLGYWIAEGEVNKVQPRNCVFISQKEGTEKWFKIKECLDRLPFKYQYKGHKFEVKDYRVKKYLLEVFGTKRGKNFRSDSGQKFIPSEFKNLSSRQLNILLDALVLGDGSWKEFHRKGEYKSSSNRLLDDVQEIALKCGYSSRKGVYKKDTLVNTVVFDRYREIPLNSRENKGNRDEFVPFADDKVYCCEVENHVLLIRRNGKVTFAGNSIFQPGATYGWSAILTLLEKVLVIAGMDKVLYRYFYERKMPAALVVTATDDPEGLRREREAIQARMLSDPDYIPWVASSAKTGRGRTDLIRLFHTLQEMDYLPIREEIAKRIGMLYGVPPLWMAQVEGVGGISGQTQQLVVFSRVVESNQRILNEKVIPQILQAFNITDWELKLAQPEEKAESTRLQFMQQRIQGAVQLNQLGFDVKIKPGVKNMEDIDFIVSGEAKKQEMGGFPGFGGMGGGEEEEEAPKEGTMTEESPAEEAIWESKGKKK